jgi:hypothetical protein
MGLDDLEIGSEAAERAFALELDQTDALLLLAVAQAD